MSTDAPQEGNEQQQESGSNAFGLPDDHPVLKELAKVRREAAESRVKKKDLEDKAQKWEQHMDSQKTELEKLQDANKTLSEALRVSKLEATASALVQEYGLPTSYAAAIQGNSEEEMRNIAEVLKSGLPAAQETQQQQSTDLHGGASRGTPVLGVNEPKSEGGLFLLDLQDNSAT